MSVIAGISFIAQRKTVAEPVKRLVSAAGYTNPRIWDDVKGPANVQRVQAWRGAHPGYSQRIAPQDRSALQDYSSIQPIDNNEQSEVILNDALQDLCRAQPLVLIGLIAHLINSSLQVLKREADRVLHAARLFVAGKAPWVIVSGGSIPFMGPKALEANATRVLLRDWGVPVSAIVLESASQNT